MTSATTSTAPGSSPATPSARRLGRALGSPFVVELVVADVVEGLDDRRPVEPVLNDLAAAVPAVLEQLLNAVDRRPVVHRVDHELAGHQGRVEGRELVNRDRQHHDIGVGDGVGCPAWLGSRHQHLGDEGDPLRFGRSRDRHAVARVDCDPCDHRADVPRTEHGDPRQGLRGSASHARQCRAAGACVASASGQPSQPVGAGVTSLRCRWPNVPPPGG